MENRVILDLGTYDEMQDTIRDYERLIEIILEETELNMDKDGLRIEHFNEKTMKFIKENHLWDYSTRLNYLKEKGKKEE